MKKIIHFGKRDFNNIGRKINAIDLEVELRPIHKAGKEDWELSICGNVWNIRHTDIICGGQCLDTILTCVPVLKHNKLYMELYRYWKLYHLNGMHAGTYKQMHIVSLLRMVGIRDYDKHCEFLKKHNLFKHEGRKYGHAWYFDPIPSQDLERIKEIILA